MTLNAHTAALLLVITISPAAFGVSPPPDEVVTVLGEKADCTVTRKYGAGDFDRDMLRVGSGGDDLVGHAPLFFFGLPKLPSRDALLGAELELHYMGIARVSGVGSSPPTFDADLFGLGTRHTPVGSKDDYPEGASSALLLVRPLLAPTSPLGRTRVSDARFRDYVASMYNSDGTPTAAYAVFRVSTDAKFPPANRRYQGYELASADKPNGAVTYTPQLTLTIRPESAPTPTAVARADSSRSEKAGGEDLRPVVWVLAALLALSVVTAGILLVLLLRMRRKIAPSEHRPPSQG